MGNIKATLEHDFLTQEKSGVNAKSASQCCSLLNHSDLKCFDFFELVILASLERIFK